MLMVVALLNRSRAGRFSILDKQTHAQLLLFRPTLPGWRVYMRKCLARHAEISAAHSGISLNRASPFLM